MNKRYAGYGTRRAVYERDGGQCQYCGVEVTLADCNIDHVKPYGRGGRTQKRNLVVACRPCNKLKDYQMIPEGLGPLDAVRHQERKLASKRELQKRSIIPVALASGIYLDDLFSEATQRVCSH